MSDQELNIRPELATDHAVIYRITENAFKDRPYADGDEQDLINRFRERGDLVLSLVAEVAGEVVAQVTFTDAQVADGSGPWFALGPVAVEPKMQSLGIGAALINAGLDEIRSRGALGCILTGNPLYYQRFGFSLAPQNLPVKESAEYFQLKCFGEASPQGAFEFNPAFYE